MIAPFLRSITILIVLVTLSFSENFEDGVKALEFKDKKSLGSVFLKSAHQGNATTQCRLGFIYEHGEGVAQDYAIAIHWYTKSAQQGNTSAQLMLANMYYEGKGVMKNKIIAYALYSLGSVNGDINVIRLRDLTVEELTTEQINQSQALTREPKKLWALIDKMSPKIMNNK